MTDNVLGMYQAWLLAPEAAGDGWVFPWSMNFQAEPRLIPESFNAGPGGSGSASFRLLSQTRDDGHGDGMQTTTDRVVAGAYVCITAGIAWGEPFTYAAVQWWGYLASVDRQHYKGSATDTGSVSASGLGGLLDGQQSKGWQQVTGTGATMELLAPPTWNVRDINGRVVGNTTTTYTGQDGTPVFVRAVQDLSYAAGSYGTRWGLLHHLCKYCTPRSLPTLVPVDGMGGPIQAYLGDATMPEVIDAREATIKGAIDLCVPRPRGFGWTIIPDPSGASWNVVAYSLIAGGAASGSFSATAPATDIDLSLSPVTDLRSVEDNAVRYDQVTVRGGRVVFCGSLACDDQADKGWNATQETQYLTAGGITQGSDSTALYFQKVEQWRRTLGVSDVFVLFTVSGVVNSGTLKRYSGPGVGWATEPFFPLVKWDGAAVTTDDGNPQDPAWQTTRFMRSIPWEKGLMPNGTDDYRTPEAKALPTYMDPMAFEYLATPSFDWQTNWNNLGAPLRNYSGNEVRPAASIACDDRRPGLRIEFSPREWLARTHLTGAVWTPGNRDADKLWSVKWENIVYTVAIESDQRVQVDAYRPGLATDGSQTRRRLVIDNPHLQCWIVHQNTVLATNVAGNADLTAQQWIKRNDYPLAQRLCDMAASWAFRSRRSITITMSRPDAPPPWAAIGAMIGAVYDSGNTITANSVVESLSVSLGASPRLTVATTLPDAPDFLSAIPSPTAGGPISVGLGGTVAQAVQGLSTQVSALGLALQGKALVPPAASVMKPRNAGILVARTSHGFSVGNVIAYSAATSRWELATVPGTGFLMVEQIVNSNAVMAVSAGYISGLSGLAAATSYWIDPATPGALTAAPQAGGPAFMSIGTTDGIFSPAQSLGGDGSAWGALQTPLSGGSSGTYTFPAGATKAVIVAVGAGGGGGISQSTIMGYCAASSGGATSSALNARASGSGGQAGGSCLIGLRLLGISSFGWTTGSGGSAGTSGAAPGDGGDTTVIITIGGATYTWTAYGGKAGGNATATVTDTIPKGGALRGYGLCPNLSAGDAALGALWMSLGLTGSPGDNGQLAIARASSPYPAGYRRANPQAATYKDPSSGVTTTPGAGGAGGDGMNSETAGGGGGILVYLT